MTEPSPRRRRSARRDQGPAVAPDAEAPPAPESTPEDQEGRLARLRKRPRRRTASPMPVGERPVEPAPGEVSPEPAFGGRPGRDRRGDVSERALRGLVTTRGTQVSWSAATRARSMAPPSDADLAAAEEELVIIRRNYTPTEPLRNPRPR